MTDETPKGEKLDLEVLGVWLIAHPPASPRRTPESHGWHEWVLVTEGMYRVSLGQEILELRADESILFPAGVMHQALPENECQLLVLQWNGGDAFPEEVLRLQDPDGRQRDLLTWVWREWMDKGADAQSFLNAQVQALLLANQFHEKAGISWVKDLELYLRNASHGDLDMKELERIFHRSPRQLTRAFKDRYHCTPMTYYKRTRAERALRRIRSGTDSVAAISRDMNYTNTTALYRALQTHFHLSPTEVRAYMDEPG